MVAIEGCQLVDIAVVVVVVAKFSCDLLMYDDDDANSTDIFSSL